MARTFRLRHLPRFFARRFIDAGAHGRWYAALEGHETSLLAAGLTALQVAAMPRHRPRAVIVPATSLNLHPWARSRSGGVQTEYKRLANRWARRATRMALKTNRDPDEPVGHGPREFFRLDWFL